MRVVGKTGFVVDVDAAGRIGPVGGTDIAVTLTPTLDTSAYVAGDVLATALLTFPNVVSQNLTGFIDGMVIIDQAVQNMALELWLFDSVVTPAAANAAHSISDADALRCIGVVESGVYYASALNSVSVARGVNLGFKLLTTTMYGILVTRGTPTYAATSLKVLLKVSQG